MVIWTWKFIHVWKFPPWMGADGFFSRLLQHVFLFVVKVLHKKETNNLFSFSPPFFIGSLSLSLLSSSLATKTISFGWKNSPWAYPYFCQFGAKSLQGSSTENHLGSKRIRESEMGVFKVLKSLHSSTNKFNLH